MSISSSRRDALRYMVGSAVAVSAGFSQEGKPLEKPIEVRCGSLTFLFDPMLGWVRQVTWNGVEVLQAIYAAVRDENWGTVPAQISNVIVETEVDAYKVNFDVVCKQSGIEYWWHGTITGAPRSMTFEFEGEAKTLFKKNRLGFCVLHPLSVAGKPVKIDHVDGKVELGTFPADVSPNQPFKDIKMVTHQIYPGLQAEVRFAGDTFEMEDQRNWTDASFKTYCTPLGDPYPVEVKPGSKLVQSVSLRLAGTPKPLPNAWVKPAKITLSRVAQAQPVKLPQIGFGFSDVAEIALVRALKPAHLRAEVDAVSLPKIAATLRQLPGTALEAVVVLRSDSAEDQLKSLAAAKLPLARCLVLHRDEASTSKRWLELARQHLPKGTLIGAGTNQNFAELNRGRPDRNTMHFVAFPVQSQIHANDDVSILENAAGGQGDAVRTARKFGGGVPVVISPATLCGRPDARLQSMIGAVWTVASLQSLAEAGAASVSYHDLAGLLDKGKPAPVYEVFAALQGCTTIEPVTSNVPRELAALWLRTAAQGSRLVLANLTTETRVVDFRMLPGTGAVRARFIGSTDDWELRGSRREIALPGYGIAVLTPV